MLSVSRWKDRILPWHTLIFWVWLASFVVSAAASDAWHGPTCPDRLILQWAGHQAPASAQAPSALHLDSHIDCAACAFQLSSAAILVAFALIFGALEAASAFAICLPRLSRCRLNPAIARGPPRL